jgi:hypothetical protein
MESAGFDRVKSLFIDSNTILNVTNRVLTSESLSLSVIHWLEYIIPVAMKGKVER